MPSFRGRVEARMTVPTGGAIVAASNANGNASTTTVTVPAANYYLTAAGGVSSLLTTLQTQLNNNRQWYPETAAAIAAAIGYGTWTGAAGYLCNETSGSLAAIYGAPATLTATGTPVYSLAGPRGGIDLAIGFDSSTDGFSGGNVFDLGGTDDLIVAGVVYVATTTGNQDMFGKGLGTGTGYLLACESNTFNFYVRDGVDQVGCGVAATAATWYGLLLAVDRANNQSRIAIVNLATGATTVSTAANITVVGSCSNASNFKLGDAGVYGARDTRFADFNIVKASGAAGTIIANMSTAITNWGAMINAAWSVSMASSTSVNAGRVSIGLSPLPPAGAPSFSLDWTNTTLRSVLGFTRNLNYPTTAAELAALVGYGTWTSGALWLCDEASGNLVASFGTPNLTPVSTPTYGAIGPRGGPDKAVGFDSSADAFSAGDTFDIASTADMVVLWVGKFASNPGANRDVMGKWEASVNGWSIVNRQTTLRLSLSDGVFNSFTETSSLYYGEWHVGIAVIDRGAARARIGLFGLTSQTSNLGSELDITTMGAISNAGSTLFGCNPPQVNSVDTGLSFAMIGLVVGTSVASTMSANLATALSNFAGTFRTWTGANQAKGLWFPDCPLNLDDDPRQAPRQSDLRTSMSPTGNVLGLCGNELYQHANLRWERSPIAQIREASATYANASLETFWRDTQTAQGGISWFSPASRVQVYWDNAGVESLLGSDVTISGWSITGGAGIRDVCKKADQRWTGQWTVKFPFLVSDG